MRNAAAGLLEPAHATEDIALRIRGRPSVAEIEQQLTIVTRGEMRQEDDEIRLLTQLGQILIECIARRLENELIGIRRHRDDLEFLTEHADDANLKAVDLEPGIGIEQQRAISFGAQICADEVETTLFCRLLQELQTEVEIPLTQAEGLIAKWRGVLAEKLCLRERLVVSLAEQITGI